MQKVLITNGVALTAAEVVTLYSLRWQIELFFKELKSTLGFAQYRFRKFAKVEGWVQACLVTFCYLEWYRAQQLDNRHVSDKEKQWCRWQRSHGVALRVTHQAEAHDLVQLWRGTTTKSGLKRLRRTLRQALPQHDTNKR